MEEIDLDLDLADSAVPSTTTASAATSRYHPKLKGKPMAKISAPKPQPATPSIAIKEENPPPTINPNDTSVDDDGNDEEMEEEDVVVQEIDVFFSSTLNDEGTSLYVMQYPLRARWRPYELDERCEEIRVKPKQSEVEIDLSLDAESENYDDDSDLGIRKQTLISSTATSTTDFAIGIIKGKQVHLNPIDAVVQLRPSKTFINVDVPKKKHTAPSIDAKSKPSEGKAVPGGDSSESVDDVEPWIPLVYHSMDSYLSESYQKRMIADKKLNIQFEVKPSDYVNFLCPGTSSNKKAGVGPSRKILLSMPLEERLQKWFSEGPQVNHFASLLYLAPNDSIEDVLKVLQQYAYLVQGLWVSKSSLLYKGIYALARDYIVFQFTKNCVIRYDKRRLPPPIARQILGPLAVQRSFLDDWKFKEPTDLSFIKSYPDIVKEQEYAWSDHMKQLMNSLRGPGQTKESQCMDSLIKSLNPHLLKKTC